MDGVSGSSMRTAVWTTAVQGHWSIHRCAVHGFNYNTRLYAYVLSQWPVYEQLLVTWSVHS